MHYSQVSAGGTQELGRAELLKNKVLPEQNGGSGGGGN